MLVKLIFAAVANSSLDDRLAEEVASGRQSCNEGLGEGQADVALVVQQGGVEHSGACALKLSKALQAVARARLRIYKPFRQLFTTEQPMSATGAPTY